MHNNAPASAAPRAAWLVAAVALGVQLLVIATTARDLAFQIPTVDSATYHVQALTIAAGNAPPRSAFWQPPLYPYTLATLYALGVKSMTAVRTLHALTAVAAALLTLRVARRLATPRLALAAALAVALCGPLVFYASQLLPAALATVTTLLALLALLRLHESPTPRRALACGAAYGLAALAIPNILACALLPLLWLIRRTTKKPSHQDSQRQPSCPPSCLGVFAVPPRLPLAFLLGLALLILPITLRNRIVGGEWVLISTNGGINLYIGNNDNPSQTLTARPGQDWERLTRLPYAHGATTPAEAERFFIRETLHYARTEPLAFLKNLAAKTWLLLGAAEIPRNLDIYVFRPHSWILSLLVWRIPGFAFPLGLLLPLALLGAAVARRTPGPPRLLLTHTALFAATLVLFYPASRYRIPLIPPLAILAALGAGSLCRGACAKRPLPTLLPLLALLILCNWPRRTPADTINFAAELQRNIGVGLQVRGQLDAARRAYDAALTLDPRYADAHYYRGTLLRLEKRLPEARTEFQNAIAARPNHAKALNDLGVLEFNAGRVELAESLLRRALAVDPRNPRTLENLALVALRLGRTEEARDLTNRAALARKTLPEAGY